MINIKIKISNLKNNNKEDFSQLRSTCQTRDSGYTPHLIIHQPCARDFLLYQTTI